MYESTTIYLQDYLLFLPFLKSMSPLGPNDIKLNLVIHRGNTIDNHKLIKFARERCLHRETFSSRIEYHQSTKQQNVNVCLIKIIIFNFIYKFIECVEITTMTGNTAIYFSSKPNKGIALINAR